ncbi:MAG: PHP domain-containing protein [Christensenellales bacterium]
MKIYYDFHIHTCLSPCANDSLTPLSVLAMAAAKGLDAIAVCDHNSYFNVGVAIKYGEALDVIVIPGMELQTAEDIHILCYFPTLPMLIDFYDTLQFFRMENDEEIFGKQLIIDEDDLPSGKVDALLSTSCTEGIYPLCRRVRDMGGAVYLAHIDRQANGILNILGSIPPDLCYDGIEYTHPIQDVSHAGKIIVNSDSHCVDAINDKHNFLEAESKTVQAIFNALRADF